VLGLYFSTVTNILCATEFGGKVAGLIVGGLSLIGQLPFTIKKYAMAFASSAKPVVASVTEKAKSVGGVIWGGCKSLLSMVFSMQVVRGINAAGNGILPMKTQLEMGTAGPLDYIGAIGNTIISYTSTAGSVNEVSVGSTAAINKHIPVRQSSGSELTDDHKSDHEPDADNSEKDPLVPSPSSSNGDDEFRPRSYKRTDDEHVFMPFK
jgi:hypothetical protein